PFQNLVPLCEPVQFVRNSCPEFFRLLDRLTVDALIVFQTLDVRLPAEVLRAFEISILVQDGFDVAAGIGRGRLLGHAGPSSYSAAGKRIADSTRAGAECLQ